MIYLYLGELIDDDVIDLMVTWLELLGCSIESDLWKGKLRDVGVEHWESAMIRRFSSDTILYNYHNEGISLCFVKDKLDSIDFFWKDQTFKPCQFTDLPFDLSRTITARELVEKLGEPEEKGGGINAKMDIWLRWKHLQVEIDERSWEAAHNATCKSFTIF